MRRENEGRLIGIARHAFSRAPIETLDRVHVSIEGGVAGDFRGAVKPGGKARRQVTVMTREDWEAALTDLGDPPLAWSDRRVNLFAEDIDLPRSTGSVIRIGESVVLEITGECDPCSRMETVAPGLRAVLTPDWRGGRLCRVTAAGDIALGDEIWIEERI